MISPLTLALLLAGTGIFLIGLAKIIEAFRPRP
jgi:hypothetical protein